MFQDSGMAKHKPFILLCFYTYLIFLVFLDVLGTRPTRSLGGLRPFVSQYNEDVFLSNHKAPPFWWRREETPVLSVNAPHGSPVLLLAPGRKQGPSP